MNRKIINLLITLCAFVSVLFYKNTVYASSKNFDYIKEKNNYDIKNVSANNESDITNELRNCLDYAEKNATENNPVLIYITSGKYYLGDLNPYGLNLPSYTTIVAEDDTELIKASSTTQCLLEVVYSESSTIYGGIWNCNNSGKQPLDLYKAKNIILENAIFKNSKNSGINISNAEVIIDKVQVLNNSEYGVNAYSSSTVSIKDSKIKNNKKHGIYVSNSTLKSEESDVSYNDINGITAGGSSKIYLNNNRINYNGQHPEEGKDGLIGHGIGVNSGVYAEIKNNSINNNSQCGISVFNNNNQDVLVYGNTINNNGRHGIGARKNTCLKIKSNNINNNSYNGVLLSDNSTGNVKWCTVNNNANIGISVVDYSNATLEDSELNNNTQSNASASGKSSKITMLSNNHISNSKKSNGISVSGTASLDITGDNNTSKYNKGSGICVSEKGASVTITGKTYLESNKVSGLVVYGDAYIVKNLYSANNEQFGVSIRNKGTLCLTNSTIKGNKIYGVHVVDSGTKAKIEKNNIYKNKSAGINVDKKATATSIYKNELNKNGNMAIRVCNSAKVSKIKKNTIKKHNKYGIYVAKKGKISKVTGNKFKSIKKKNQIFKTK